MDINGETIGTITLTGNHDGVLLRADMDSLPPGVHGFHLHEVGECDPATGFETAGGHISGGHMHGFLHDGPTHPGDMPNIYVPESGSMIIEVVNERISLAQDQGAENPLTDKDGASLVIHSGADDYISQPSGDAGDRIACAVLTAR
jgi:Cu-Zn family superoxide dismutase